MYVCYVIITGQTDIENSKREWIRENNNSELNTNNTGGWKCAQGRVTFGSQSQLTVPCERTITKAFHLVI